MTRSSAMGAVLVGDRARRHSARDVLRRIDEASEASLLAHAQGSAQDIAQRLHVLDREWDLDRTLETEAAAMALLGLALGRFVHPGWLALPAAIGAAVCLFALKGWYPLLPAFRRMGVRTSREIARERYALKALRGDFAGMAGADATAAARAATPAAGGTPGVH